MLRHLAPSARSKKFLLILCVVIVVVICVLSTDHHTWYSEAKNNVKVTQKRLTPKRECASRNMLASFRNYEDVSKFDNCGRIFYNRAPKCASRTILSAMRVLAQQRNFTLVSTTRGSHYTLTTPAEIVNFTRHFNSIDAPFIYSKHMSFFNFTDYGMPQPVYINVIRDPFERAVSHYYYSMYGSSSRPFNNTGPTNKTGEMKECVSEKECRTFFHLLLPFFCGHKRFCKKYHSASDRWILVARAKQVVRQRYLVVGLTEDLPAFMEVLEGYMPSFFKNATNVFNDIGGRMKAKYKTVKKATIDKKLEKKLKKRLEADYDFYGFVKQRFYNQLKRVRTWKEEKNIHHIFQDVIRGNPIHSAERFIT